MQSEVSPIRSRAKVYLLPALALLTIAVFIPVLWNDFVDYDDFTFVVRNPHIQSGLTLDGIIWAFTSAYEANWVPLTWISHMLDIQMFGMNPAGHHGTNLLFHVSSTLLLYLFLRYTTAAPFRSVAVALLFALHPLHVESVAWIAERKDVLSAFFWMLTLNAYARYADRPDRIRYGIVLVLFTLGLLAKPMLVTLPLVLLLLDWWPLGRMKEEAAGGIRANSSTLLRMLTEKVPFLILSLGAGIVTCMAQHADISHKLSFPEKAERALTAYAAYLGKMLWPVRLSVIYPFSAEPPSMERIVASAMILLIITGAVLVMRRRAPYLVTGWLWYLITLLPVIGLVQIGHHSIADRYTYIPLVGVFMMIAWSAPEILKNRRFGRVALAILSPVILMAGIVITEAQLTYWRNSAALFSHALDVTENNWIAHTNLGKVLFDEGRLDEAVVHFTKAAEANSSYALAYLNLGFAYYYKYEFDAARTAFERALESDPGCHPAHFGLGLVYLAGGKVDLVRGEYESLISSGSSYAHELMDEIIVYNRLAGAAPPAFRRQQ